MSQRLLIVQPYVPGYRVPFFAGLIERLARSGIEVTIIAGRPQGAQLLRGDATSPPWLFTQRDRSLNIRGVTFTRIGTAPHLSKIDGVIVPAAGTAADAYEALLFPGRRRRRVGLWGHIGSYVSSPNRIDLGLERWQMARADRVFAYTPGGALTAAESGVPPSNITTVMNSVDTAMLGTERINQEMVDRFVHSHGLAGKRVFAFWGGLDESKRIGFLAESLDALWELDRSIVVMVGGRGADARLLSDAVKRGQAHMLGFVDNDTKSLLGRVADGILMPGRIGLIAVEALSTRLPVLTTSYPFHAPEVEYLEEGVTLFTSDDSPSAFALSIVSHRRDAATHWPAPPTLENMISNFALGVEKMLE